MVKFEIWSDVEFLNCIIYYYHYATVNIPWKYILVLLNTRRATKCLYFIAKKFAMPKIYCLATLISSKNWAVIILDTIFGKIIHYVFNTLIRYGHINNLTAASNKVCKVIICVNTLATKKCFSRYTYCVFGTSLWKEITEKRGYGNCTVNIKMHKNRIHVLVYYVTQPYK